MSKKLKETYKVRISKPGDLIQKMTVTTHDPKTRKLLKRPMFAGIENTHKYRPDFEKRGHHTKINIPDLGVMFMKMEDVVLPGGKRERVAFRDGQGGDRIENAVEEYDVPVEHLHLFAPYVKHGWVVVEGDWDTDDKDFMTEQVPETQAQAEEMGLSAEDALSKYGIEYEVKGGDPDDPKAPATATKRGK